MPLAAILAVQTIALRPPEPYPLTSLQSQGITLRTWAEHNAVVAKGSFPYRVRSEKSLVFGFHPHTNDPNDRQLQILGREWTEFRPTVILVEGRPGVFFGKPEEVVARIGETGWAMRRAQDEKLKIWSWEPTVEAERDELLKHGSREDAVLMLTLRTLASRRRNRPVSDADAANVLERRQTAYGMKGVFPDLAAMETYWNAKYAKHGDWRVVPEGWKWAGEESSLSKMSFAVGDLRTSNLVRCVRKLVLKGERVLAICGSGHAIRGESGF